MRIRYYADYSKLTGYGRAARDCMAALAEVGGVEIEIVDYGCADVHRVHSPEPRYAHLDRFARSIRTDGSEIEREGVDVEVVHAPPRVLAALTELTAYTGPRVAMTTWETSEMPPDVAAPLNAYNAIIVPSDFCARVIEAALEPDAVEPTICVDIVPHTFDPEFWVIDPDLAAAARAARNGKVRFYSVGAWGERKNMSGVVKAYLHAFGKGDPVQLLIQSSGVDLDEARSLIARSGIPIDELPEIIVTGQGLTERELVELHGTADCYVSAARGEGWGLGAFEAAIMGRRVISPTWSGEADYLDDYPGHSNVLSQLTPCFGSEGRPRPGDLASAPAGYAAMRVTMPPGVTARQMWGEPDLDMIANAMRDVAREILRAPDAEPPPGMGFDEEEQRDARADFERRFGYKTIGPLLATTLREIIE